MSKLHLCCGDVYLKDYINCDIEGVLLKDLNNIINNNPNETTIDKYFKEPFVRDAMLRKRKTFVLDIKMNILENWQFEDKSIDEIVMVSAFEHFEHLTDIPHIVREARRVLKLYGRFKFDFPDLKAQMDQFYSVDDEFLMELIYCNHKNKYSIHNWGYTRRSIVNYFTSRQWALEFKDVVKHDYPMQGVWAQKIS